MIMKVRHPEKVNKPVNPIKRKPNWIKSKIINSKEFFITKSLINKSKLSYCLSGSKLPKYNRMLEQKTCNFYDYG